VAQLDDVPPIKTPKCWERQTKNIPELGQLVDIRILDDYGCTVDLQIIKLLTIVDLF